MTAAQELCDTIAGRYLEHLSNDLEGRLDTTLDATFANGLPVDWVSVIRHVRALKHDHARHCHGVPQCGMSTDLTSWRCRYSSALRTAGLVAAIANNGNIERLLANIPVSLLGSDQAGIAATLTRDRLDPNGGGYTEGSVRVASIVADQCWEIAGLLADTNP